MTWGGLRGGISIALALSLPTNAPSRVWIAFLCGGLWLAGVGVFDDIRGLRANTKLALQSVAGVTLIAVAPLRIDSLAFPGGEVALGALALPFTLLWILALVVVVAAFRGVDLPVLGGLQLVAAV